MDDWTAIILATGCAQRLNSRAGKALPAIAGRPLAGHVMEAVREAGVKRLVMVAEPEVDAWRQGYPDVAYVTTEGARGVASHLLAARPMVTTRNVLVISGQVPLLRGESIRRLIERHAVESSSATLLIAEANQGTEAVAYCFDASWLWPRLEAAAGEYDGGALLDEVLGLAAGGEDVAVVGLEDSAEALVVDDGVSLAEAEAVMRRRISRRWMLADVTIIDPATTYIDADATIGADTTVHPNTHIRGRTLIGNECQVGPNSIIADSVVGDRCCITASVVESAVLEEEVDVGPFSHLRPETYLSAGVHVGNYVEVKKARLGRGVKVGHFSYIGDAQVGDNVNIGAGTITCNYDGVRKNETVIEDDAFIGSDTMLVAPVRVGRGARTGAGAVVTRDVPPGVLVVGVPARARKKSKPASEGTD